MQEAIKRFPIYCFIVDLKLKKRGKSTLVSNSSDPETGQKGGASGRESAEERVWHSLGFVHRIRPAASDCRRAAPAKCPEARRASRLVKNDLNVFAR